MGRLRWIEDVDHRRAFFVFGIGVRDVCSAYISHVIYNINDHLHHFLEKSNQVISHDARIYYCPEKYKTKIQLAKTNSTPPKLLYVFMYVLTVKYINRPSDAK